MNLCVVRVTLRLSLELVGLAAVVKVGRWPELIIVAGPLNLKVERR